MKICEKLLQTFKESEPLRIYEYLKNFGMYTPNRQSLRTFEELKKVNMWQQVGKLLEKYKRKWQGPDIPIYIFPLSMNFTGFKKGNNKSGLSFKDKMFLFLVPLEDEKEIEALFVHEYHHVCRMNRQKKDISEYTLLDSIILEGLAEHAVKENCGKAYVANWCRSYSKKEIHYYWSKFVKENLEAKKNEEIHDQILFGLRRYPKLIGYAVGYDLIDRFKSSENAENFSTKTNFDLPSEIFLKNK